MITVKYKRGKYRRDQLSLAITHVCLTLTVILLFFGTLAFLIRLRFLIRYQCYTLIVYTKTNVWHNIICQLIFKKFIWSVFDFLPWLRFTCFSALSCSTWHIECKRWVTHHHVCTYWPGYWQRTAAFRLSYFMFLVLFVS